MGMPCWKAKGIPFRQIYFQKELNKAKMKCSENVFTKNKGFSRALIWFKFTLKPYQGEFWFYLCRIWVGLQPLQFKPGAQSAEAHLAVLLCRNLPEFTFTFSL